MNPTNTHELFILKLQKLYDGEQQLTKALPKMAEAADDAELKKGFEQHLQQTEEHARRLETLAGELNYEPSGADNTVIKALVTEGEQMMQDISDPVLKDLAMIAGGNTVEHVEMAGYKEVLSMAKLMHHSEAEKALKATLNEEEETSKILEKLAEKLGKQAKDNMGEMETE
jgi:ferritin-like metal-binding protein YciE